MPYNCPTKRRSSTSETTRLLPEHTSKSSQTGSSTKNRRGIAGLRTFLSRRKADSASNRIVQPAGYYVYQPLNHERRDIRILRLKKAKKKLSPLRCELMQMTLSLAQEQSYEAVSYCWGDERQEGRLKLDDTVMHVPGSAELALRALRLRKADRLLWIDAVCINQSDRIERGHQVAMMGEVYRGCTAVLVWLGVENTEFDGIVIQAKESMQRLLGQIERESSVRGESMKQIMYSQSGALRQSDTGISQLTSLAALEAYYNCSWFNRLWVVQEAVLAPRGICYRGSHQTDLSDVLRVAAWLRYKRGPDVVRGIRSAANIWRYADSKRGAYMYASHQTQQRAANNRRRYPTLAVLLSDFRDQRTSEPRDKVYALLGLSSWSMRGQRLPQLLEPDYGKPVAKIFADATRAAIMQAGNLNVLECISRLESKFYSKDELPCWVPQWDISFSEAREAKGLSGAFYADDRTPMQLADQGHDTGPEALELKGIPVDTVKVVTPVLTLNAVTNMLWSDGLLDMVLRLLGHDGKRRDSDWHGSLYNNPSFESPYASMQNLEQALYETLSGGSAYGLGMLQRHMQLMNHTRICKANQTCCWKSAHHTTFRQHQIKKAAPIIMAICENRRFFVTAQGRMGLGPRTMNEGDVVTVLFGGKWPFLLRDHQSHHHLVGAAYVHGVMYGEAVRQQLSAGVQARWFDIR